MGIIAKVLDDSLKVTKITFTFRLKEKYEKSHLPSYGLNSITAIVQQE